VTEGRRQGGSRGRRAPDPPSEILLFPAGADVVPVAVYRRPVRSLRLRVMPDGSLTVTCPRRSDVEGFLREKERWIRRKREELRDLAASPEGSVHRILLDGEFCTLCLGDACGRTGDGTVAYTSPAELRRWLSATLRGDLVSRVAVHAAHLGLPPPRFAIRHQRSRWASCSTRAGLSFNLRMAALPPALRDYLVVHELVHLREPNHSPRYWDRVREYWPRVDESEKDLARFWILIERNEIWQVILAR